MKKSTIGGKRTAKRKILIRQFIENTIKKDKRFSDPFEDDESQEIDDSEWNLRPLKINYKKNHKLFDAQDENLEESQPDDDILVKNRDLAEADRFIASLKLPVKRSIVLKENQPLNSNLITNYDMKVTFEKFKVESEKLTTMLNDDFDDELDRLENSEDFLI